MSISRKTTAFIILLLSAVLLTWTLGLQAQQSPPGYLPANYPIGQITKAVPFAWTPAQFVRFFGLHGAQRLGHGGRGTTIAFIESQQSFDAAAWRRFAEAYGPSGAAPLPTVLDSLRSGQASASVVDETMLDVEWAHVVAPLAHLVVVEASPTPAGLVAAVEQAASLHPTAISISVERSFPYSAYAVRSGQEWPIEQVATEVPIFAASGDSRDTVTEFDELPSVITVGGMSAEWVYHGSDPKSGSGYAWLTTPKPVWQQGFVAGAWRAFPDVSWIMDFPSVVVATRGGWTADGGTSLSTPLWAALWALSDAARMLGPLHAPLPANADAVLYYLARHDPRAFLPSGGTWSAPSGLGEPNPTRLVQDLSQSALPASSAPAFPWTATAGFLVTLVSTLLPAVAALLLLGGQGDRVPPARYMIAPVALILPPVLVRIVYLADGSASLAATLSTVLQQPWIASGWILLYAIGTYRLALWATNPPGIRNPA